MLLRRFRLVLDGFVRASIILTLPIVDTFITQGTLSSGGGLAFVFEDFLKYMVQDGFGVVMVIFLLGYP
jgi:hypothetical protein